MLTRNSVWWIQKDHKKTFQIILLQCYHIRQHRQLVLNSLMPARLLLLCTVLSIPNFEVQRTFVATSNHQMMLSSQNLKTKSRCYNLHHWHKIQDIYCFLPIFWEVVLTRHMFYARVHGFQMLTKEKAWGVASNVNVIIQWWDFKKKKIHSSLQLNSSNCIVMCGCGTSWVWDMEHYC